MHAWIKFKLIYNSKGATGGWSHERDGVLYQW